MNLSNAILTIDDKEFKVTDVKVDFLDDDNLKANVQGFYFSPKKEHINCMCLLCFKYNVYEGENEMRTIPDNVEKFLDDNFKAFYALGYIDEITLELTDTGKRKFMEFLFEKHVEEFGKEAQAEFAKEVEKLKDA